MLAIDFPHKITLREVISTQKTRFHVLSMRAIDFPHKVTPREVIFKEKKLKNFFEKNHAKWDR